MQFEDLKSNWNRFGQIDPLWSILTEREKRGNRWDREEFFATGVREIAEALAYAESHGVRINRGAALDFGCGVGRLTQALAGHFDRVVGVDVAQSMIDQARQFNQFPQRCEYVLNEREDLSVFDSGTFDFIYTCRVLQHMEPRYSLKYVAEFLRLLKPDGVLVFQQTAELLPKARRPGGPMSWRRRVMTHTPEPLLNLYARVKASVLREPKMEAYGIRPEEVVDFVRRHGGTVQDVSPDDWGGSSWLSHHYCVTRAK